MIVRENYKFDDGYGSEGYIFILQRKCVQEFPCVRIFIQYNIILNNFGCVYRLL